VVPSNKDSKDVTMATESSASTPVSTPSGDKENDKKDEKKNEYLYLDESEVRPDFLDLAVQIMTDYLITVTISPSAGPPSAGSTAKVLCAGGNGCIFWGDEKTENMCSVCYRQKYLGPSKEEKEKEKAKDKAKTGPPAAPTKCTRGCGYFGTEKYRGMCSQCYSKEKDKLPPLSDDKKKEGPPLSAKKRWKLSILKVTAFRRFLQGKRPEQKNKNKCWKCRRKIGISGIECRCGYIFCGKHRYANEHDCLFDHKQAQRKKLAKENQEVKGAKFEKIGDDE